MEAATFRRDRLQAAMTRLEGRRKQVRALEEDRRRRAHYDKIKDERDRLAKELTRVYPAIAAQLGDLLARIDANDREIAYVNRGALPNEAERLDVAEQVARGLRGFNDGVTMIPRITHEVRLPNFAYSQSQPFVWRPRQ